LVSQSSFRLRKMLKKNKVFFVFLGLFFISLFSFFVFFCWGIYSAKNPDDKEEVVLRIEKGENLFSISRNLEKNNLIRHRIFFQIYVFSSGDYKHLQAGSYFFSPSMNIPRISQEMARGEIAKVKVVIPEGLTSAEIEDKLNSKINQTVKLQLENQNFKTYKGEFSFLKDAPDGASLEGFLFPDTYDFAIDTTSEEAARIFLVNFEKKLSPQIKTDIEKQGKRLFDIVIMASLLEKEVITLSDKKIVSGILWKRLEENIPLQVDATVGFAKTGKAVKISREDTLIDSPYNTYKYKGLPIGPICSPGLKSIEAAVYPEASQFWYYLSAPSRQTIFSRTYDEHLLAKAKYLP